jgi:apolipoprotein N-acyltransferase
MLSFLRGKKFYSALLAIFSGLFLGLAWFEHFSILVFLGFALLIEFEQQSNQLSWGRFFAFVFLSMLIWNVVAIWWLWNASGTTTLAAWGLNALFMTLPFLAFRHIKKSTHDHFGNFALIVCWLAFEYLHIHWDFSWIWLLVGNCFMSAPQWVQWYEYTGVGGGTLWVLVVAILLQKTLFEANPPVLSLSLLFGLPLLASYLMWWNYQDQGPKAEIALIQPNFDPYTQKFEYNAKLGDYNPNPVPYSAQLDTFLSLSKRAVGEKTQFLLYPETSLHSGFDEAAPLNFKDIERCSRFLAARPDVALVAGVDCYRFFDPAPSRPSIRKTPDGYSYEAYNAALFMPDSQNTQIYHKSKLVIGVETIPFAPVLGLLMLNMGGQSGGLGKSLEGPVVFSHHIGTRIAPVICYESVYGQYVGEFVQKGAQFIGVITNDGWWGNTPGHRQHLDFSRLRAIETRRYVARAANTGVTCFINARGEMLQSLAYEQTGYLRGEVRLSDEKTFYVQHGDYLARVSAFLAGMFLVAAFARSWLGKRKV